jgi:hypothetical protein
MTNHCGSCTACCKVFAINDPPVKKPAGKWCEHCAVGKGCKIYDDRPETCSGFECLWLLSQSRVPQERLAPELRPDRSKVVFSPATDPSIMTATTMPDSPNAWQRQDVRALIDRMITGGYRVVVGAPAATRRIMLDRSGLHDVRLTEPDEDGMQWNIPPTRRSNAR